LGGAGKICRPMRRKANKTACAYFEAIAAKVGGDVKVFQNAAGEFVMQRRDRMGAYGMSFKVSLEEKREIFERKVRALMKDET